MDDKGRLIVSGHLDREERSAHRITIMAETDASPALSAYYHLTVKVLDENDNAPAFSSDLYEVTVSEASAPSSSRSTSPTPTATRQSSPRETTGLP